MSDRTDEERLDDIRQYASEAIETLGDSTYADFLNDSNLRRAVFYLVAVVGEVASKISQSTRRQYPTAQWRRFRGLRNVLIHEYHSVEADTIYEAVTHHLPALLTALETTAHNSQGGQPS